MARQKNNMAGKLALGVTGVAVATGVVVAGAALANKKNRTALKRGARKTVKKLRDVREAIEEGRNKYQAFQHRIGMKRGVRGKKK